MKFLLTILFLSVLQVALSAVPTVSLKKLNEDAVQIEDLQKHAESLIDPRIAGGAAATSGQFPWQAAIYNQATPAVFLCSGALIYPTWVLTSASCLGASGTLLATVSVRFGSLQIAGADALAINAVVRPHPRYTNGNAEYDLALLMLATAVPSDNAKYGVINLERTDSNYVSSKARVAGWGATASDTSGTTTNLNFIEVNVVDNTFCQNFFSAAISDSLLCTNGTGNKGVCVNDAGSALAFQRGSKSYHIGVTSFFVASQCSMGYPSGFVRTGAHYDWIETVTGVTIPDSSTASSLSHLSILFVSILAIVQKIC